MAPLGTSQESPGSSRTTCPSRCSSARPLITYPTVSYSRLASGLGSEGSSPSHRRIETALPSARYFWPISPLGEVFELTFLTLLSSVMILPISRIPSARFTMPPGALNAGTLCWPSGGRGTQRAEAAQEHGRLVHDELVGAGDPEPLHALDGHVVEPVAAAAAEVVVVGVGVGVVEHGAPALDSLQHPRLHERRQRVVDGSPRELGQPAPRPGKDLVGGQVPTLPVPEGGPHGAALRGDP